MKTALALSCVLFLASGCGGGGGVSVGNSSPSRVDPTGPLEPIDPRPPHDGDDLVEGQTPYPLVPVRFQVIGVNAEGEADQYWNISTQTPMSVHITEASAQVESLRFLPANPIDCDAYKKAAEGWPGSVAVCVDGDLDFDGPFALDFIRGESTPAISALALPEGNYAAVRLRLRTEPGKPGLRLRGIFQDKQNRPVIFEPTLPSELDFYASALAIHGQDPTSLIVEVSVKDWFMGTENDIVQCRINSPNQGPNGGNNPGGGPKRCDAVEALLQNNLIPASNITALH